MTKQLRKEIENKYKPKVLRVDKLKEDNIILTDTYSWRDFRQAIDEAINQTQLQKKQEMIKEFKKVIDEWNKSHRHIHNTNLVSDEVLQELKSKLKGVKE